ncbi:MAG TPA: SMP-30/gluconolactonase/LRE family protein [Sphingomicrobium sp.]|nr:SMP-30/gluconolactonase/LRE family protein [Sphingomicrobium sp.]
MFRTILWLSLVCTTAQLHAQGIGTITREDRAFSKLVPEGAAIHVVAHDFTWAEGPAWISKDNVLLLSDPPKNRMYRWAPGESSASIFLEPSGGSESKGFREAGSNGLKPAGKSLLLVADEGDRAIAVLDLRTKTKRLIATQYRGKRLNSPNDIAVASDGAIWFTDPPYGLDGIDQSPAKQQTANRVYRIGRNGALIAEVSELRYPNGIAFSPDGRTLYVSNSDPKNAVIIAWHLSGRGTLSARRVFADMNSLVAKGLPGLPDGMTVDERGDVWASGPGGIHVFTPQGHELGLISTGTAISNCTFGGADRRTLYMTSTHLLVALRTNVRGAANIVPTIPVPPYHVQSAGERRE